LRRTALLRATRARWTVRLDLVIIRRVVRAEECGLRQPLGDLPGGMPERQELEDLLFSVGEPARSPAAAADVVRLSPHWDTA
jgi:hypothetical protein